MTARRCGAAVLVSILGLAASITRAGQPPTAPTVDCESRSQTIGGSPPARPSDVVAGPLILRGGRIWAEQPRSDFEPQRPGGRVPVKLPFIVKAGRPATLAISAGDRSRGQIMVGLDRAPRGLRGPEVRFVPCAPDATVAGVPVGPRTVFVGGFRIDGPLCLHLTVVPDGSSRSIDRRIAFGRGTCRNRRR